MTSDEIGHLIAGTWSEPRRVLARIVELVDGTRHETADLLDALRRDEPLALWLADELRTDDTRSEIRRRIDDEHWLDDVALGLTGVEAFGAISIGPSTRRILQTLSSILSDPPVVFASSTVVARGIEDLEVEVRLSDNASAGVTLIPAAARFGTTVWTSAAGSAALDQTSSYTILLDPLSILDDGRHSRYAPPGWLVARELPGGQMFRRH
jgi:hypothetical protein